jgi:hypothetical protein
LSCRAALQVLNPKTLFRLLIQKEKVQKKVQGKKSRKKSQRKNRKNTCTQNAAEGVSQETGGGFKISEIFSSNLELSIWGRSQIFSPIQIGKCTPPFPIRLFRQNRTHSTFFLPHIPKFSEEGNIK